MQELCSKFKSSVQVSPVHLGVKNNFALSLYEQFIEEKKDTPVHCSVSLALHIRLPTLEIKSIQQSQAVHET